MSKKHGQWIDSLSGKNSDLEKRFGVSPIRMSKGDGGTWEEDKLSRDNYQRDMIEGARNDYDLRRTMEAAAMSGKKKAIKLQKKGFNDIGDVRKWQNFSEKAAKRHGQGGAFDSASDYMGLTKSMVLRDRRKQEENLVSKDFLEEKLADLKATKDSEANDKAPVEYTDSERFSTAKERLNDGTYNTTDSMFKSGVAPSNPTTAFRASNQSAPKQDDRAAATNSYLEQYKEDMVKGGKIGQAYSSNMANAFNTVIGNDIT